MTDDREERRSPVAEGRPAVPSAASCRSFDSRELLAGAREVLITHGDSIYRLRATSSGKLLLTK